MVSSGINSGITFPQHSAKIQFHYKNTSEHGHKNWGTGARAPHFQNLGQSAPFHVTWLPSLNTPKMHKQLVKYTFPVISGDLSSKILRETMPPDPLANLHIRTGPSSCNEFYLSLSVLFQDNVLKSRFKKPCQGVP